MSMNRKALAAAFVLILLSAVVGLCYANPDWPYYGADWKYVTSITGTSSQTTDVLVPNQAHWRVTGNCTTAASAKVELSMGGGGTSKNMKSSGLHSVGLEEFSSGRGPATFSLKIVTQNVYSYTLVVEYDANAPTAGTTPPPSPSPSPSQSPSPQETEPEPFPATWLIAAIASIAVGGTAFTLYYFTKNRKTTLKNQKSRVVCF